MSVSGWFPVSRAILYWIPAPFGDGLRSWRMGEGWVETGDWYIGGTDKLVTTTKLMKADFSMPRR